MPVPFRSHHAEANRFGPRPDFVAFHEEQACHTIIERLLVVASRRGTATALVDGPTSLSYNELMDRALTLGSALACQLGEQSGAVALATSSPRAAVEGLLGILCAGRSYLCLPVSTAHDTGKAILQSASPAALLTDGTVSGWPSVAPLLRMDDLRGARGESVAARPSPTDVACLFATSGTTGAAKLVGLSHRAVVFDIGRQTNDLFLGPDDRIDLLFHPSFSASLSSIFSALLTGAQLHIGPSPGHVTALGQWLKDSQITVSTLAVSTLRMLCASLSAAAAPPSLRLLSVGGEALLAKDVRAFHAVFPESCVLQNAMASTETRTYAQYFVPRDSPPESSIPIGWPVHGKDIVVVDPDDVPVPEGEDGEILVRSRFLATGYVNDPALTAARFAAQPDGSVLFRTGDRGHLRHDGCLVFVGRGDALLKIRGYRVEPGAVEHALRADSRIREAAVVRLTHSSGEDSLAAFVVPDGERLTEREIRGSLLGRLPAYAVPSTFHIVAELPLNLNGKVDYQCLAERAASAPEANTAPVSPGDRLAALCASWAYALDKESAGPETDFFASGGDSLSALRLQSHVHRMLDLDLSLSTLVRHPSPSAIAAWLDRSQESISGDTPLVTLHPGGSGIPLFCIPGIGGEPLAYWHLAERVGRDRPVYGFRATMTREPLGGNVRIETIARDYLEALSAVLAPGAPVHLCGHSFGGIVALEMAHQLRAKGRALGLFAIIDTPLGAGRPGLFGRARDTAANLPAWLWYDAFQSSRAVLLARLIGKSAEAWRRLRPPASQTAERRYPDLRSYFGARHVPVEVQTRVYARFDAARHYVRRPLPGHIVLFRSRAQALMGRSDRCLGWDALCSSIEVYDVPGHHDSCTKPPHVQHLADKLALLLLAEEVK